MVDIAATLGALLVGGCVALVLSGIISVQCIIFYRLYANESRRTSLMVFTVWLLDMLHSAFIVTSFFDYFISFFGDTTRIDHIPWSVALSVVVTAGQTLIVHWYFTHKIYESSGKNWWITAPIALLAFLRLFAASISTSEMIILHRYSAFNLKYPGWVFTTGLSLSASVDIIITGWLCYFLQKMRRRTASTLMVKVVQTITLYTLENGLLTCITTTASLICWLAMPNNLVFLGLHFVIGKLYANSLLMSLNTRQGLREMHMNHKLGSRSGRDGTPDEFTVPHGYTHAHSRSYAYGGSTTLTLSSPTPVYRPSFKVNPRTLPSTLEISVERQVESTTDELTEIVRHDPKVGRYRRPSDTRSGLEYLNSLP
ncbi:hypothetical protein C8R47DRAFT_134151 [Mycena vitilis]|nr:hypothetical protein C8R47DRAFT_134151 [Mycena vitilis]